MVQLVPQTKEEKIEMYMKCNKRALAEMLYQVNMVLESWTPKQEREIVTTTTAFPDRGASDDYPIIPL